MKGIEAISRILKKEGIEFISCFPLNYILDAAAEVGIRPIVARTERMAVTIADGFSRMNNGRRIGVCAVQYGPGSEAAFGAMAAAYSDCSPILCLAGAYDRARLNIPPNFRASTFFSGITKWAATVNDPEHIPQLLHRAFSLLRTGKPGPVLLEFPADVVLSEVQDDAYHYTPPPIRHPWGDPSDVAETLKTLCSARNPVIMAGQGVLYSQASGELLTLAELLGIPVMSTLSGKSAFPENHALSLGTANGFSRPATVDHFLSKADLVLGVGTSFTISKFTAPIPRGKIIGQVTIDESDLGKDYQVSFGAIGDAKAVLGQMIELVRNGNRARRKGGGVTGEIRSVREAFLKQWMPRLTSNEKPINPYRVVWELMHAVDASQTVITHDSGNPRDQLVPFYESVIPGGYLGWGKSTPLGASLGLMMGAKLARPDLTAIHLMGDAAFGMVGMDLETAVRNRIPVLTVLMNNGVMGGYTKKQPSACELYGLHRLSGDYCQVACALGAYAERIEDPEELKPGLYRALKRTMEGFSALLEVITRDDASLPGQ